MSAGSLLAVAHGAVLQAGGVLRESVALVPSAAEPSPSPSTVEIPPEDQTSPGLLGFLVTFAVAVAVIALAFSLVRHLRVVERNARRLEEEDAATAPGDAATAVSGTAAPGTAAASPDGEASGDRPGPAGPAAGGGTAPGDRDRP